jgi:membrane fusion protein, heavy metal efflux system
MNPLVHPLPRILLAGALAGMAGLAPAAQPLVCLIQPSRTAEIGSSVTGVIESISVERGDTVSKGQVIAVLRNGVERAALDVAQSRAQANADVQAAQAALTFAHQSTLRAQDLVKKKFVSEQALDKARSEEEVAAQRLAQAREQRQIWDRERSLAQSQLAQRTLVSPISGIVAERYLSSGERVEDRSVARVVSIHPLHVEVMVPAASFGKIKTGMTANVVPELPDAQSVEARVILVDRLIDGASNTFRVRLELPNPDHAIPAGPRCKVAFGDQVIGSSARAPLKAQPAVARTPTGVPATGKPAAIVGSKPATPPVASKPAAAADSTQSALSALEAWRRAWAGKDMAAYLAAYAADFRGESPSRSAWVRQREARISKPGTLDIRISEARVQAVDERKVRVQFRQHYQAGAYRDVTLKSLLLVLDQGRWLIREERAVR